MNVIRTGLGNDVDDSARRTSKLSARASRNNLKLFYRLQCDIDRRALSAELFAKESVVVVASIERNVVEDSALTREIDFVAVGTLRNAYTGCECKQVFKFSSQNWCCTYCLFI